MKQGNYNKRFLFVPVICMVILCLTIIYQLLLATGIFEIDFVAMDNLIVRRNEINLLITDAKHPLMPKTENAGEGYIDINNANSEELDNLPEIGEKRADAIVAQRAKMGGFSTLRDLLCAEGIGAETYEKLEHYIRISEYLEND